MGSNHQEVEATDAFEHSDSKSDYTVDESFQIVFGGKQVVVEPDQTPLVMTVIRRSHHTEPFSPYQTINS